MPFYYHFYATANDDKGFAQDLKNFRNMVRRDPGVDLVRLRIAVSLVKPSRWLDQWFIKQVKQIFNGAKSVRLEELVYKQNKGRDFSSYGTLYRQVTPADEDFLFFQNRSADGPWQDNWYKTYVDQYLRDSDVAICGTTINFMDHPARSHDTNTPHVQSYAFVSQHRHMRQFREAFPGENEEIRLQLILNGEIGLSQAFLHRGKKITCLNWPDLFVEKALVAEYKVPRHDAMVDASANHPFLHRRWMDANRNSIPKRAFRKLRRITFNLMDF